MKKELQTGYEKKYGMAENSVRSLLASSDGNLYVGYMAGLAVFSPGQDAITHVYTTRDGLCSNFIGCMTEDADGKSGWALIRVFPVIAVISICFIIITLRAVTVLSCIGRMSCFGEIIKILLILTPMTLKRLPLPNLS